MKKLKADSLLLRPLFLSIQNIPHAKRSNLGHHALSPSGAIAMAETVPSHQPKVLIWCLRCTALPVKFAFLSEKESEYPKCLYSEIVHSPFSECFCKAREQPAKSTRGIITRAYSNLTPRISLMPFALNTCEIEVYLQKNFLTHSLQSSKCYYRCLLQTKVGKFWCP